MGRRTLLAAGGGSAAAAVAVWAGLVNDLPAVWDLVTALPFSAYVTAAVLAAALLCAAAARFIFKRGSRAGAAAAFASGGGVLHAPGTVHVFQGLSMFPGLLVTPSAQTRTVEIHFRTFRPGTDGELEQVRLAVPLEEVPGFVYHMTRGAERVYRNAHGPLLTAAASERGRQQA